MTYEFVTLTNQVTTAQWGWTIALYRSRRDELSTQCLASLQTGTRNLCYLGCGWDFVCAFALASPAQLADGCNQFVTRMEV